MKKQPQKLMLEWCGDEREKEGLRAYTAIGDVGVIRLTSLAGENTYAITYPSHQVYVQFRTALEVQLFVEQQLREVAHSLIQQLTSKDPTK